MRALLSLTLLAAGLLSGGAWAGQIPRPAGPLTIQGAGMGAFDLAQLKGKVVALEFLSTTCPDCQQCARLLSQLQEEFGPRGFQSLGVAVNPNPDLRNFSQQFAVGFPVGAGARDTALAFLQKSIFEARLMMPQLVFIDRAGQIRAQYAGDEPFFRNKEQNVREWIERLLAEPEPAKGPAAARRP